MPTAILKQNEVTDVTICSSDHRSITWRARRPVDGDVKIRFGIRSMISGRRGNNKPCLGLPVCRFAGP